MNSASRSRSRARCRSGSAWIVGPLVEAVPRETLEFTLGHVRAALVARGPIRSESAGPPGRTGPDLAP